MQNELLTSFLKGPQSSPSPLSEMYGWMDDMRALKTSSSRGVNFFPGQGGMKAKNLPSFADFSLA